MAIYNPKSKEPFTLSRTKVELFLKCPRCFYFDRRLGIGIPSGPGFSLNSAVDELLKKEFDIHRAKGERHPLMAAYGIDAIPIHHEELDLWRENFKGVRFLHNKTNLELFGAIDDLWKSDIGKYFVVDYKATSTQKEISLEDEYKKAYKKQMEFYQYLLRGKGFDVSDIGYFVFCNGLKDRKAFDGKLEFDLSIISHEGDSSWIEPTILEIKKTLDSNEIPAAKETCEYCNYIEKIKKSSTSEV